MKEVAVVAVRAALEGGVRTPARSGRGGYLRYPSVQFLELEAGPGAGVRLLDPKSMEEMALALPDAAADAVEMLRRASICRYGPTVVISLFRLLCAIVRSCSLLALVLVCEYVRSFGGFASSIFYGLRTTRMSSIIRTTL